MPVSSLRCKWIGVERINGEGTAETGVSDAEEMTLPTLAGIHHTCLKKIFFTERTEVRIEVAEPNTWSAL